MDKKTPSSMGLQDALRPWVSSVEKLGSGDEEGVTFDLAGEAGPPICTVELVTTDGRNYEPRVRLHDWVLKIFQGQGYDIGRYDLIEGERRLICGGLDLVWFKEGFGPLFIGCVP